MNILEVAEKHLPIILSLLFLLSDSLLNIIIIRQRQKDRDRKTDTKRQRQKDRDRKTETERQIQKDRDRDRKTETERQTKRSWLYSNKTTEYFYIFSFATTSNI